MDTILEIPIDQKIYIETNVPIGTELTLRRFKGKGKAIWLILYEYTTERQITCKNKRNYSLDKGSPPYYIIIQKGERKILAPKLNLSEVAVMTEG